MRESAHTVNERLRKRAWRKQRRQQGICATCSNPSKSYYCATCSQQRKDLRSEIKTKILYQRELNKAEGLCVSCGRYLPLELSDLCRGCFGVQKMREYRRLEQAAAEREPPPEHTDMNRDFRDVANELRSNESQQKQLMRERVHIIHRAQNEGWTLTDIAEALNISRPAVSKAASQPHVEGMGKAELYEDIDGNMQALVISLRELREQHSEIIKHRDSLVLEGHQRGKSNREMAMLLQTTRRSIQRIVNR